MRFFITTSFDAIESAELNAVILGIIVAVLVILLPPARRAQSMLKKVRERAEREVNALGVQATLIVDERWDQYALETDEQFEDMRLRLEQIVDPERTERIAAEEEKRQADVQAAVAASTSYAELRAQLIERLRKMAPEKREELRPQIAEKVGNESADKIFQESEGEPPRPRPATQHSPRQLDKLRSSFPPPDSDTGRGMTLLKIIAAIWAQPPFPRAIRQSGDRIVMQDPRVPVALPDAHAAHEWVETTDRVAQLMRIIDAHEEKVQSLLGAARDANYEIEDSSTDPQILIDFNAAMKKAWDSLYLGAASAWEIVTTLRADLTDQLAVYEADRPRFAQRGSLIAALIGGWCVFFAGVILPLIATQVPRAVYLYLPLAYYFVVLFLVIVASIRSMLAR